MSQENVEKVRAYFATWDGEMLRPESQPFERINSTEAAVALLAPSPVFNRPDERSRRGVSNP